MDNREILAAPTRTKEPAAMRFFPLTMSLTAVLGLVAFQGCGDAGSSTSLSTSAGSGSGGGPIQITCDGAPADLTLDGTWAAYGKLAISFQGAPGGAITICPTNQIGESTLLLLMTVQTDAADKTKLTSVTATLCSLSLPVVKALVGDCDPSSQGQISTEILVPKAFLDALPSIATAPSTGTLAGLATGSGVMLDRFTVTAGTSKTDGVLPSWDAASPSCTAADIGRTNVCDTSCVAECAALRDDDADGYPGMTAEVCGKTQSDAQNGVPCNTETPNEPGASLQGRAFLSIEVDPQFQGTAESSCEIKGTVDAGVNYAIAGADIYLAGAPIGVTSAIKSLPAFQVDPAESRFRAIRIDGQFGAPDWGVDPSQPLAACAELVTRINEF
jgi:hypothetical protein